MLRLAVGLVLAFSAGCLPQRGHFIATPRSGDPDATASFTPAQIETLTESIVHISAYNAKHERMFRGSGVVVSQDDRPSGGAFADYTTILTAGHMMDPEVSYYMISHAGKVAKGSVWAFKGESDWMILIAEGLVGSPAPTLPRGAEYIPFGPCLAIGHPLGDIRVWVTEGRFQGATDAGFIRFTSPIIYGNSGGALVGLYRGQPVVVGITVAVAATSGLPVPHLGYAVPLDVIRKEGGKW